MRPIHFIYTFLLASVMALPTETDQANGQVLNVLKERQPLLCCVSDSFINEN